MENAVHTARVPSRRAALWLVAALLVLTYIPTGIWLVDRWSMGVWYHIHGFLVFPAAIWLAHDRLRTLGDRTSTPSAWGFFFLVPAVVLQAVDAMLGFEILSAISLVVAMPGLCLLFLGKERTKALWFPLLFLIFAIPIPLMIVRRIHLVLRGIAALSTEEVLAFLGYEVTRSGTSLQIGPEAIEIADACSGFATLSALTMAALLLPYLARASWRRGGILMLFVFPVAVVANVIRCVVLCMLCVAFGTEILATPLHSISGVATFCLALFLLMQVERLVLKKRSAPA